MVPRLVPRRKLRRLGVTTKHACLPGRWIARRQLGPAPQEVACAHPGRCRLRRRHLARPRQRSPPARAYLIPSWCGSCLEGAPPPPQARGEPLGCRHPRRRPALARCRRCRRRNAASRSLVRARPPTPQDCCRRSRCVLAHRTLEAPQSQASSGGRQTSGLTLVRLARLAFSRPTCRRARACSGSRWARR